MATQTLYFGVPNKLGSSRVGVRWTRENLLAVRINDATSSTNVEVRSGDAFYAGGHDWRVLEIHAPTKAAEGAAAAATVTALE